jgi:hypothetical protein
LDRRRSTLRRLPRSDRLLLALEIVFGVLPVTIVGGGYSLFGLLFGTVYFALSVRAVAFDAFAWWCGVFALAAGGFVGIVGLWAVILISASSRRPSPPMIRVAVVGSGVGVLTAASALLLMGGGAFHAPWYIVYGLVAPIVVVVHRARAIAKLLN